MRRIHSATAYVATFLVAGGLLGAVAVLPPALGFLLAVCAAFGWSALLELAPRPWRSSRACASALLKPRRASVPSEAITASTDC